MANAKIRFSPSTSARTRAIVSGKPMTEEMEAAAKKLRAALRKPVTIAQLRKVAGVGTHSVRALMRRMRARPADERGTYRL